MNGAIIKAAPIAPTIATHVVMIPVDLERTQPLRPSDTNSIAIPRRNQREMGRARTANFSSRTPSSDTLAAAAVKVAPNALMMKAMAANAVAAMSHSHKRFELSIVSRAPRKTNENPQRTALMKAIWLKNGAIIDYK